MSDVDEIDFSVVCNMVHFSNMITDSSEYDKTVSNHLISELLCVFF